MKKNHRRNMPRGKTIGMLVDNYSHEVLTYREGMEDKFIEDYADMLYHMGANGATYRLHSNNVALSERLFNVLLNAYGIGIGDIT